MNPYIALRSNTCARSLRANRLPSRYHVATIANGSVRRYTDVATRQKDGDDGQDGQREAEKTSNERLEGQEAEEGALTRRLREMSEEALESGGSGARKAVEDAGFSPELKAILESRIAAANLATSEAAIPSLAPRHSRDLAATAAWTGTESIHDASLRMLNDAHKPMRLGRPPRAPGPSVPLPRSVDTGHKKSRAAAGIRLANARDRSGLYSSLKEDDESEPSERERRLQDLKDRFDPNARAIIPGTIQGLASLANKKIEDAIARGQFKNIPRGKGKNVERDYNANSPFIDTTEYFMNKIIQKQEIVPPWIEKQQELTSAANKFRGRLRSEWKRHAARIIASKGGSLQDQVRRAEAYAKAELVANPLKKKQEVLTTVDNQGQLSQISLSGELKVASPSANSPDGEATVTEEIVAEKITLDPSLEPNDQLSSTLPTLETSTQTIEVPLPTAPSYVPPAPFPFRDPDWERIESGYHAVVIKDLNDKARSYNLQAPDLAKKPYFNLQRELNACFADVAPQLAEAILDRARKPVKKMESFGLNTGEKGFLGSLGGGPVRVRDERREKQYGFKQFWNELWEDKSKSSY
ncbi:hypothetical protein P153DRAFT_219354 [Dothidotthia symphoricarpi CBS 119687]|uniref:DnaJ homologue subfamily C member 28 conserved domain-containing protein n=1 Tax=Dothidotthia symphoricarpi CBS 119687 TaxID=1392245 RepID=A0A6A6AHD6_9PLEO|nr:uncharacterized protein P153DRAFT_219354 [Dothidotthia symphoricarpi CBS 119687]KAF2130505.1 hypothetical protein P153DRAFT_219354 [Dothidotthia symphoricarpi CBS 119687]